MKDELRVRFRAIRDALAPASRAAASRRIAELLSTLPEFAESRVVLLYASFGTEVDTLPIVEAARSVGKSIALPRMEERRLHLHRWKPSEPLVPNRHSIPEPLPTAPLVPEADVDLIVVPGVAFDRRGARLGYGGGYYDRLLKAAPRAVRVGVAFQAQIVPKLPSTHLDVPVDVLVTEAGVNRLPPRSH